jgi:redox-sensing transcriptional repressor
VARALSEPTLRRLPTYCHHLERLHSRGLTVVSCTVLGRDLNLDSSQIRKDLEVTGIVGKPKVGYPVPALIAAIRGFLGWDRQKNAVLAGAEGLGPALLGLKEFDRYGLKIVGVFDADERLIGADLHGFEVRPLGFLPGIARSMRARVGIITLPEGLAQDAADLMAKAGVRAIWNLAPVPVRVPAGVFVENGDFYFPLAALSCRLARQTDEERS